MFNVFRNINVFFVLLYRYQEGYRPRMNQERTKMYRMQLHRWLIKNLYNYFAICTYNNWKIYHVSLKPPVRVRNFIVKFILLHRRIWKMFWNFPLCTGSFILEASDPGRIFCTFWKSNIWIINLLLWFYRIGSLEARIGCDSSL